tara:strand:- start:310 stop:1410 length:1101 start_codon:yes stop_codon:yes gene_type:complete
MKIKYFIFYLFSFLIFILSILITDIVLSNTVLKQKHCINYQEYFYELKKNCKGKYRFKTSFPLVKTYTDVNGLRVKNHSIRRSKDKKDLFIFGDSMTYGVGLEYDKSFVGIIDNEFQDYNIYNFGLSSYSTTVYLYQLKETLKKNIIPDKVLIFLDLSDLRQDASVWYYDKEESKAKLYSRDTYDHELEKEKNFKNKNFKISRNIASYVNFHLRNLRAKLDLKVKDTYKIKKTVQANFTYTDIDKLDQKYWSKELFNKGIKNISNNLTEFKQLSEKYKFDVFLIVYPWIETIEYGQEKFNWSKFVKNICDSKNCKTIDTFPDFLKYKESNKNWVIDLYFLNDVHFNENGSKVFAKIVINKLKKYLY